jgi:hypothetical protein
MGYCCEEETTIADVGLGEGVARLARIRITYRTLPRTPHAIATLTRPDNARTVARVKKAAIAAPLP